MSSQEPGVKFHEDPLLFLDRSLPVGGHSVLLPDGRLCLADPAAAKAALANAEGLYEEHADFFQTQEGMFGPRSAQLEVSREARNLLKAYLTERAARLPDAIRRALAPESEWPDAGNRLMHAHLGDALVSPDSPASLRKVVGQVVERAVLVGARERAFRVSRWLLRWRVRRELTRAIAARRARRRDSSGDLLDVVVRAAGADMPAARVAEVFLSCVFAVTGSVGFVLGWSLYLWGTHPSPDAEPAWVVREALRLWPVAWMLAVRPAKAHTVVGVDVTPRHKVIACPYLVHRNPAHWPEPEAFRPERWAGLKSPPAFIPFGWGPHTCPAALLSMGLVEDVLRILSAGYTWTVTAHGTRPFIGSALAPPRFTLSARPRPLSHPEVGSNPQKEVPP